MAGLRIFVSSTCYDLSSIRSQLRTFIRDMGYDPIMSDYNDVLYDPRIHTHTSCIEEVSTCDIIILIVGSRFGGKAIPEAISRIDFEDIQEKSKNVEILKKKDNISVTQLEILKAVEKEIPIFTFIEGRLWNDHALYEKNKDKGIIDKIDFPSIEKQETAKFIFEFINFLRHRTRGNSINNFTKFEDISETLRKQLSGLFQRLLGESRNKIYENRRMDNLSEQFDDLKTAILTSIGSTNNRDIARGMVRYRRLIDFLRGLMIPDVSVIMKGKIEWDKFLQSIGIAEIIDKREFGLIEFDRRPINRGRTILIKTDGTFFELKYPKDFIYELKSDFEAFMNESEDIRAIIYDALGEIYMGNNILKYNNENIEEYIHKMYSSRNKELHKLQFSDEEIGQEKE